jgi:hypothetical protein
LVGSEGAPQAPRSRVVAIRYKTIRRYVPFILHTSSFLSAAEL